MTRKAARPNRPGLALAALALVLPLLAAFPELAGAQGEAANARNAYTPAGRNLSSRVVREELERRLARNPRNEAAIWNAGYDFYRNFPPNQDTARAIKDGFLTARTTDPDQRLILRKAAIYWEKVYLAGRANVPVAQDPNDYGRPYYGDTSKASTLPRRQPGEQYQGHPDFDWPGRFIKKREPYQGRPDNPYPGKYYPGMYPP